jgi:YD repeat-containing protein
VGAAVTRIEPEGRAVKYVGPFGTVTVTFDGAGRVLTIDHPGWEFVACGEERFELRPVRGAVQG